MRWIMKEHEKLAAFMLLGFAVMLLAVLAIFYPVPDGSGSQRIVDAAMGGLLLALGGASNALFRIRDNENVTIDNKPNNPVPTTDLQPAAPAEELPDYAR